MGCFVCQMAIGEHLKSMIEPTLSIANQDRSMKMRTRAWNLIALCCVVLVACHREGRVTAWTTGEPNAPPDVAAVYRAVLDDIFPSGPRQPALIVIDQMTEPTPVDIFLTDRVWERRPAAAIAPFAYRIPIVLVDTTTVRDLWRRGRAADSIVYMVPVPDLFIHQRSASPFMQRFPGAWGRLTLGRVAFGPDFDRARVEVRYWSIAPMGNSGSEQIRLTRTSKGWNVVDRIPRQGSIEAIPIPYAVVHPQIDSSSLPVPRRRSISGTVKDSASGRPVRSIMIRIESAPLGPHGEILRDKGPEPWGTVLTDSAGRFAIFNPPSGFAYLQVECLPKRGVRGAGLVPAALDAQSGLDTIINFRVTYADCARLAPVMAQEAERHRQDVIRAKLEAAARAVQGNIWGTLRDSRTGHPIPRAWIRVDERGGLGGSDSTGRFWLWGFAPGKHKIIVYCPLRRQWLGKVATTLPIDAQPAMKDTMDIAVDMQGCVDVPVDTVRIRTRGVLSSGFEDGFFTPCKRFDQIKLGGYRDFSGLAYLGFAGSVVAPNGGWPKVKPENGYTRVFLDVEGDLIGPGSYGHLGVGTYELVVTKVFSAKAASRRSCGAVGAL